MKHIEKVKINPIADNIIRLTNINSQENPFFETNAKVMLSTLIDFYNTFRGVEEEKSKFFHNYIDNMLEKLNFILENEVTDFLSLHKFLYLKLDDRHTPNTFKFRQEKYKELKYYVLYNDYKQRSINMTQEEALEENGFLLNVENATICELRHRLSQVFGKELIEILYFKKWIADIFEDREILNKMSTENLDFIKEIYNRNHNLYLFNGSNQQCIELVINHIDRELDKRNSSNLINNSNKNILNIFNKFKR